MSVNFYNENVSKLAEVYLSKIFTQVHCSWLEYLISILKKTDAFILDLGAGRDSKYMAEQGKAKNAGARSLILISKLKTWHGSHWYRLSG